MTVQSPKRPPKKQKPVCPTCHGKGAVQFSGCYTIRCRDCAVPYEPIVEYQATAGTALIDTGRDLTAFIRQLDAAFDLSEASEDLAIWCRVDDAPARLVAVLRPGLHGNVVMWI